MTQPLSIDVDTLKHKVVVGGIPRGKRGCRPGEFHYPSSAAVLNGRAYIADSWNHRVQVFDLPEWKFAFEFGGFFCPKWIEIVEDHGRSLLIVVDTNNARLCFHEADGCRVETLELQSRCFPVSAHVVDSRSLEVVFEDDHREVFDMESIVHPAWWTTKLDKPISIVRDRAGFMYVSDFGRRTLEKFDADGKFIAEVLGPDSLNVPGRMVMNGDDLLVTDRPANAVIIFNTLDGTHRRWNPPLDGPGVIGRDPGGALWIAPYRLEPDPNGATFSVFNSEYKLLRRVTFRETHQPTAIGFAGDRILIADQDVRTIFTFLTDGSFVGALPEKPFDSPAWSVICKDGTHIFAGIGQVVDLLWVEDLKRMYYIEFDVSAVRFSPDPKTPFIWKMRS